MGTPQSYLCLQEKNTYFLARNPGIFATFPASSAHDTLNCLPFRTHARPFLNSELLYFLLYALLPSSHDKLRLLLKDLASVSPPKRSWGKLLPDVGHGSIIFVLTALCPQFSWIT